MVEDEEEVEVVKDALTKEYKKKIVENQGKSDGRRILSQEPSGKIVAEREEKGEDYFPMIEKLIEEWAKEKAERWLDNHLKKPDEDKK